MQEDHKDNNNNYISLILGSYSYYDAKFNTHKCKI